ncbi:DUF721 domain-containing protein [Dongia sp.]|uniref:DUF721 domain-containing protein n=1 Tax=Dongia sp. TaxID=1977262 RepID=UPI0035B21DEB
MSAQEEKSGKKIEAGRKNRLSALASSVPALTKLALGRKGFAEASLIGEWTMIVGEDIARLAIPVKMRLPRAKKDEKPAGTIAPNVAGGTLTLRASPAASLEIQHLKPRILERIQRYFGYPAITEIRIEIGEGKKSSLKARRPAPGPVAQPDLSHVTDPDIREALRRLGAARAKRV